MTPRRGELEPDTSANVAAGMMVGAMVGAGGWMVQAWPLFLPVEWTFGAGWWAPVVACSIVGGIMGKVRR